MYWYCATHGLKAIRNNLFRSQSNMARTLTMNGQQFGWKEVKAIYLRDVEYYHKSGIWRTDLKKEAITLDGYSLMNAAYAKSVFSEKTICFQMSYLAREMNDKIDYVSIHSSTWHKYHDITQNLVR